MSTAAHGTHGPPTGTVTSSVIALVVGLLALTGVLLGLLWTGAAEPLVLGDAGPVVRWGLPIVTVFARLAAALTLGAFVMAAVVLPSASLPACRDLGSVAAASWALFQAAEAVLTQIQRIGRPPQEIPPAVLVSAPAAGAMLLATVLTATCAVASLFVRGPRGAATLAVVAVVTLAPIAETGHAAGGTGHGSAATSMWLHLIALGAWSGGLATLLLVRTADPRATTRRFSSMAGWAFVVVAGSGVANTLQRIDSPTDLIGSGWGQLVIVKLLVFTALGYAGHLHRSRTMRSMDRTASTTGFRRLAAGELVLMGAAFGVSVALAASPPPSPDAPTLPRAGDAVLALTGAPLPPAPSLTQYLVQWRIEPVLVFLAGAAIVVYVRWVGRLRQRGDRWPLPRTVCAVVGILLFVWTTSGGPAVYGAVQFSAHMAQHLILVTILPIFYALSAPATLALRALPRRTDDSLGPREWLLILLHSRWGQFVARPIVASLHVVVAMLVLYATPFFSLTLVNHWAHLFMIVHISIVGYLFVNAVVGLDPGPTRPPYGARLVLLVPPMLFHTFFGLTVMSSSVLIAPDFYARLGLPWLADPLADQQIGGALTWAVGELPALGLALAIATRWVMADQRAQDRAARRGAIRRDLDDEADDELDDEVGAADLIHDDHLNRADGNRASGDGVDGDRLDRGPDDHDVVDDRWCEKHATAHDPTVEPDSAGPTDDSPSSENGTGRSSAAVR